VSNDAQIARAARPAPTDAEVASRAAELAELEAELVDRELLLKTCRAGLRAFEASYLRAVRPRYAELDLVEAEIAEAMAAFDPENEALAERARQARERARASAEASDAVAAEDASGCHTPSVGLKRLYRRVALQMHPDRGADPAEVAYRHDLMVEANRAYRHGDAELLETLLGLFDEGAEDVGERAELRRVLWQINRVRRRLDEVARELEEIEASEIFGIWRDAEVAADQGRDLVAERVASIRRSLGKAQARLEALRAGA
jgi:hypothetical protein